MHADELVLPWFGSLAERLPGMRLAGAYTHLGASTLLAGPEARVLTPWLLERLALPE